MKKLEEFSCVTAKLYGIGVSIYLIKSRGTTVIPAHVLSAFIQQGRIEQSPQWPLGPQSQKYFLSGPLQNQLAIPWAKGSTWFCSPHWKWCLRHGGCLRRGGFGALDMAKNGGASVAQGWGGEDPSWAWVSRASDFQGHPDVGNLSNEREESDGFFWVKTQEWEGWLLGLQGTVRRMLCLGELVAVEATGNMQRDGRSEQGGTEGHPESHKGLRIQH